MKVVNYKGYEFHMEFNRIKYGLARWDYTIYKDGKEVGFGCDVNTQSSKVEEAVEEIFQMGEESHNE